MVALSLFSTAPARLRSLRVAWRGFVACRRGGAVLYVGVGALTLLTSVGGMMTNFAWREAQQEEIQAALRASVSAVGQLLDRLNDPDTKAATEAAIKDRVAKFLDGLLAQIDVDDDDVTVTHEATSRITRISIGGQAQFAFNRLFGSGGNQRADTNLPTQTVAVQLLTDRYEVAVAADITSSMSRPMRDADGNFTGPKRIDALKTAADVVEQVLTDRASSDPGSMTVAVLPFGSAVNVADTSGSGDTVGKRRYAHMLIGEAINTDTARASSHHWVDTFHSYGSGDNMGELQARTLPDFILGSKDADGNSRATSTADWALRSRTDSVDVKAQVPMLCSDRSGNCNDGDTDTDNDFGVWQVHGVDMWNGCVMARWGAYWDADARSASWDADNPATTNWPARADAARWTPARSALTNEPLHLSDAPPDAANPNTRFTAYSWPDARIARNADGQLHAVMAEMLDDATRPTTAATTHTVTATTLTGTVNLLAGFNDWSARNQLGGDDGGSSCPDQAILPLSDDATTVAQAFDDMQVIPKHAGRIAQTFLHLGVVWGLRAVSPLWQDVWTAKDANDQARPLAACAEGETGGHCDPNLKKVIVLITDGYNAASSATRGRIAAKSDTNQPNPSMATGGSTYGDASACSRLNELTSRYGDAMADTGENTFNNRFAAYVDGTTGAFTNSGLDHLVDTFDYVTNLGVPAASTAQKAAWKTALTGLTPWQLFRSDGFSQSPNLLDSLMAVEKTTNKFGFQGRPMHNDHICRRGLAFSPYGAPDDLVQVGGTPVAGVAPFTRKATWTDSPVGVRSGRRGVLDDWLLEACRLAGERDVRIHVVFLDNEPTAAMRARFNVLEQCIDKAGGTTGVDEVFATPTQQELTSAFENIFRVERNLRFLN